MTRDYKLLGALLVKNGFFSEYLPPCFSFDEKLLNSPPPNPCDLIPPYNFTMSRFNGNESRRTIFIPEIGAYLVAHFYMEENGLYQELIEFTESCRHSFSPVLDQDNTIAHHEQSYHGSPVDGKMLSSQYIINIGEKIIRAAGAKKVLKLDISNCYSSFYMHMIPAIQLGAETAEIEYNKYVRNHNDKTISPQYLTYSGLDQVIRQQNLNRTNGLLPGILSSKLIAEAILTRIDKELEALGIQFVRYVDDYEVFIYDHEEKSVITIFSEVLKKYGFSINAEKTEVIDFPFYISENFERLLRNRLDGELSREDLINIFNTFFELESNGTKGAIRYLLKHFEQTPPITNDPDLYKAYLLTVMANNERSLSKSCILLLSSDTASLTPEDTARVVSMLRTHIADGHDMETLWLLYLLIETKDVPLDDSLVNEIIETSNELAHAMLFRNNLLTEERLDLIRKKAKSWILLYELYAAEKLEEAEFATRLNVSKNIDMYRKFKQRNIHFIS